LLQGYLFFSGCGGGSSGSGSSVVSEESDFLATDNENSQTQNTSSEFSSTESDKEAILSLIDFDDSGLLEGLQQEETEAIISSKKSRYKLADQRWYRSFNGNRSVNKDIQVLDDIAEVTISRTRNFNFNIDVDFDRVFGQKEANHASVRYAQFAKFASEGWKLIHTSMVEINMQENSLNTISINEVSASVNGTLRWIGTSPSQLMNIESELPTFYPGDEITVTVSVSNTNGGVKVFLHNKPFKRTGHTRRLMFDDGTTGGDKTAGDNIFTRTGTAPAPAGYYHVGIDVIDAEAFDDETSDNYRAYCWIFPYRVIASE